MGQNEGKLWCSTRTDVNGNHMTGEGHYGFCPGLCIMHVDFVIDPRIGGPSTEVNDSRIKFEEIEEDEQVIFIDEDRRPSKYAK